MNHAYLVADVFLLAKQADAPPWWLYPLFALIGFVMCGIGLYSIVTQRAVIGRRQKFFLRLFGVEEITGVWAILIGCGQFIAGCIALGVAVIGPFIAGVLADPAPNAAAPAPPGPAGFLNPPANALPQPGVAAQPNGDPPNGAPLNGAPPSGVPRFIAGHEHGQPFRDQAPPGGLLAGLRLAKGENWGGALQAVQPVYQVGTQYQLGSRIGTPGGDEEEVIARTGYAVGAINARAGAVLNAMQLVFYRIDGKSLNANDRYESAWIGCDGGQLFQLEPKGPITEIFGTWEQDLASFGVQPVSELPEAVPLPTSPPPDLFATPRASKALGLSDGTPFTDVTPAGGVLVGVRASCDGQPKATVRAIRPLYLSADGYSEGEKHGTGGEFETVVIARPGFAVGGIEYHRFGDSAGLRLLFVRVNPMGLDAQESYFSPWLGYPWERGQQRTDSGQRFVAGITGYTGEVLNGIGLMLVGSQAVRWPNEPIPLTGELRRAAAARAPLRANQANGRPFSDQAPEGGLLVGMRLAKGKNWGGALQAVQPIYRVGTQDSPGARHGQAGGEEHELVAKPGYAVGAVHARAGLVMNAVQLVFYRIDGKRLNREDRYESTWIGCDGGGPFDLDAQGDPIVRLFGTHQEDLISLGIEATAELPEPASEAAVSAVPSAETASPFRIWRSADGRSQVEAKMLSADETKVQLERRDGKRVAVPFSKLSDDDVKFARESAQPK